MLVISHFLRIQIGLLAVQGVQVRLLTSEAISPTATTAASQLSQALHSGSFDKVAELLPSTPGNVVDINIMNILNCCYKSSDILRLLNYLTASKFYISSYMYECLIITAARIGDSQLVSTLYESAVKRNGRLTSLIDALLHAYRVCDSHQKLISYVYQLFNENVKITSIQYEDILRTLVLHSEYDSLCNHIITKMREQNCFISLPILSILLNSIDVRSSSLTIAFIRQTRFSHKNAPLLNIILSREIVKFSEKKQPKGVFELYREMSNEHLQLDLSELSRLKRVIGELIQSGYQFTIRSDDDVFTRLYSQCWLEQRCKSSEDISEYADMIRCSMRNRSVEFFEGLKFVMMNIFIDSRYRHIHHYRSLSLP